MLASRLHHPEDGAALLSHADSTVGKMGLQSARHFCLRQRHVADSGVVATGCKQDATNSRGHAGQEYCLSCTIIESQPVATELQLDYISPARWYERQSIVLDDKKPALIRSRYAPAVPSRVSETRTSSSCARESVLRHVRPLP